MNAANLLIRTHGPRWPHLSRLMRMKTVGLISLHHAPTPPCGRWVKAAKFDANDGRAHGVWHIAGPAGIPELGGHGAIFLRINTAVT